MLKFNHLFSLALLAFLFISCSEDDKMVAGDPALLKFWIMDGYYDADNNKINLPDFDPQTIPHYEITLFFKWQEHIQSYEITGKAPYELYIGALKADDKQLKLTNLWVADNKPASEELLRYDKLFFETLNKVTRYEINGNKLLLYYGNSEKMVFTLSAKQYPTEVVSKVSARINGQDWESDPDRTIAGIHNDWIAGEITFSLSGSNMATLSDNIRYDIGIVMMQPPHTDKYYFNNSGVEIPVKGVSGSCIGTKTDEVYNTRSTDGYVEITRLTPDFVEGIFEFNASSVDQKEMTNHITDGKFLIAMGEEMKRWFKTYPHVMN